MSDAVNSNPIIRRARREELAALVRLLQEGSREPSEAPGSPLAPEYAEAFDRIDADPSHELRVAELDGTLVGTLQLTIVQYLNFRGKRVGFIEAVRVAEAHRRGGIATAMLNDAMAVAKSRGCSEVRLTSHPSREAAHRLYEKLGFKATHTGFRRDI